MIFVSEESHLGGRLSSDRWVPAWRSSTLSQVFHALQQVEKVLNITSYMSDSYWPSEPLTCFFRTASLSPNVDRTRDFVGQGQTDEEREEEARKAREQEEKEKREKEEMDMPLQLATLPGKQEIVLKFTEMNQVKKFVNERHLSSIFVLTIYPFSVWSSKSSWWGRGWAWPTITPHISSSGAESFFFVWCFHCFHDFQMCID